MRSIPSCWKPTKNSACPCTSARAAVQPLTYSYPEEVKRNQVLGGTLSNLLLRARSPGDAARIAPDLRALVAGALIAFLQAMTLFGSPAILALPAGFHTMTTKIWSLFQYPPKLELAAAAAVPLLLLTILLLQGQKFLLGRRGFSVVGGKYGAPRLIQQVVEG